MKNGFLNGFDISHLNGAINFEQMVSIGHKFCFIKRSEGGTFADPMYDQNAQAALRAGLLIAPYHFYRPQADPQVQAEHFLNLLGGKLPLGSLPPIIDVEVLDGVRYGALQAGVLKWLGIVEKALNVTPIFYSYRDFLLQGGDWSAFASYPLWLAVYTPNVVWPKAPLPWIGGATFWQYSASNGLDLNVASAKITLDGLRQMAGIS